MAAAIQVWFSYQKYVELDESAYWFYRLIWMRLRVSGTYKLSRPVMIMGLRSNEITLEWTETVVTTVTHMAVNNGKRYKLTIARYYFFNKSSLITETPANLYL